MEIESVESSKADNWFNAYSNNYQVPFVFVYILIAVCDQPCLRPSEHCLGNATTSLASMRQASVACLRFGDKSCDERVMEQLHHKAHCLHCHVCPSPVRNQQRRDLNRTERSRFHGTNGVNCDICDRRHSFVRNAVVSQPQARLSCKTLWLEPVVNSVAIPKH